VKFGLWNCQSIRNKTACFTDYICSKNVDLFALTETWLTGADAAIKAECTPDGYKMLGESRSDRKGGGTALVYRSNISAQKIGVDARNSFEVSEFVLVGSSWRMRLAVIYKPPYSSTHRVTSAAFLSEFTDYLESFVMCTEPIIITGDFNFHVDNANDPSAAAFMDLLDSMDLVQHVCSSTQVSGHTLDLIITRKMDTIITSPPINDTFLSDHSTVLCDLNLTRAAVKPGETSCRKLKGIDFDSFKKDILSSTLCQTPPA
jgi:hypothetical protein